MPRRRKRRPPPSQERPGDAVVAALRKQLKKQGGPRVSSPPPRDYPAAPRVLEEREPAPLPAVPRPQVSKQYHLNPQPIAPPVRTPHMDPLTQQAPPSPKALGVPALGESQRAVATPPDIPQVSLPGGNPKPPAEETPAAIDAPLCPLLGSKCLHEWCEWWDGISQCHLVSLSQQLSQLGGRLQGLQDYLQYRLGTD